MSLTGPMARLLVGGGPQATGYSAACIFGGSRYRGKPWLKWGLLLPECGGMFSPPPPIVISPATPVTRGCMPASVRQVLCTASWPSWPSASSCSHCHLSLQVPGCQTALGLTQVACLQGLACCLGCWHACTLASMPVTARRAHTAALASHVLEQRGWGAGVVMARASEPSGSPLARPLAAPPRVRVRGWARHGWACVDLQPPHAPHFHLGWPGPPSPMPLAGQKVHLG
jgi:hypothetical protein